MSRALVTRQAPCFSRLGAGGARVERTSRHGKDFASLLAGEAGGDQRPGPFGGLHHDDPSEMPEIRRLRRGKSLPLGAKPGLRSLSSRPCSPMCALEVGILRRVDDVDAAGEHGDGAAFERGEMGRGVDAARQALRQ